jgi:hypothetical protein
MFKERIAELSATQEQAEIEADRIAAIVDQAAPRLAAHDLHVMAVEARSRLSNARGGLRRTHIRALVQRVEVISKHEIRVRGSQSVLLKALAAMAGGQAAFELGRWNPALRNASDMDDAYVMTAPLRSLRMRAASRSHRS